MFYLKRRLPVMHLGETENRARRTSTPSFAETGDAFILTDVERAGRRSVPRWQGAASEPVRPGRGVPHTEATDEPVLCAGGR